MACPRYRGIAGLWAWPLVNLVLALVCRIAMGLQEQETARPEQARPRSVVYVLERDESGRIVRVREEVVPLG